MNDRPDFEKNGLIPVIVQDSRTEQVLMLAYTDEEAFSRTCATKTAWFWSRSRRMLWNKGETSGNFLYIEQIYLDCDRDTLLYRVRPAGPVCHTGHTSCFYTEWEG